MEKRAITGKIPVKEVPSLMRAVGFYPSEEEVSSIVSEVKVLALHGNGAAGRGDRLGQLHQALYQPPPRPTPEYCADTVRIRDHRERYVTPRTSPSLLLSCFMHYNRSFTNVALLILKLSLKLSLNLSVPLPQPREGGGCSLGGAKEGAAFGGRGHRRLGLGGLSGGPGGCRGHSRGQGRVWRLSICRRCTRLRKTN